MEAEQRKTIITVRVKEANVRLGLSEMYFNPVASVRSLAIALELDAMGHQDFSKLELDEDEVARRLKDVSEVEEFMRPEQLEAYIRDEVREERVKVLMAEASKAAAEKWGDPFRNEDEIKLAELIWKAVIPLDFTNFSYQTMTEEEDAVEKIKATSHVEEAANLSSWVNYRQEWLVTIEVSDYIAREYEHAKDLVEKIEARKEQAAKKDK